MRIDRGPDESVVLGFEAHLEINDFASTANRACQFDSVFRVVVEDFYRMTDDLFAWVSGIPLD